LPKTGLICHEYGLGDLKLGDVFGREEVGVDEVLIECQGV